MSSEFNHIDHFFQNKNEEVQPDSSRLENDWKNMQTLLHAEAGISSKQPSTIPAKWYWRLVPRAAATLFFLIAATLLITFFAKNKKTISPVSNTKAQPAREVDKTTKAPSAAVLTPVRTSSEKISTTQKLNKRSFDNTSTLTIATVNSNTAKQYLLLDHTGSKVDKPVKESKLVFEEFYSALEKPAQQFTVDNRSDTLIKCKEGTTVFIPAGSFQSLTGLAVVGLVNIRIREFYSFADMVSHKLNTSSQGKRLETAGMINIQAAAGENELRIKEGAFLDLEMPTRSFDPTMQLFVTEKKQDSSPSETGKVFARNASFEGLEWIPAGQQQFFLNDTKKLITILNLTDNPYEITNYKNGTRTMAKFMIPYDSPLSVDEMKIKLEKKYGRYYDKIKVRREWGPMFGKKRKDTIVTTRPWYESKQVGDSITLPLSIAMRMKLVTWQDSIYYETLWRKQYEEAVRQKQAWSEYVQKREAYSFRISNLGWINCDRFVEYPKGRLTDFVLNPGEGFEGGTFNAILILENERSAMQGIWSGGKIRFPSLPLGHQVNIVCAGVKNGVMYTVVQKATISRKEVVDLEFEVGSPEDFKEKLLPFGDVTKPN